MKYSVNLYQDILKPKQEVWTLERLVLVSAVVFSLVVAIAGLLAWQQHQLAAQQQTLALELQTVTDELSTYQKTLSERKPAAALESALATIQLQNSQKQNLLDYLQVQSARPSPDFQQAFLHLKAIDPTGLWLTEFSFAEQGFHFVGRTHEAKLMTTWLQQLGTSPFFDGHAFQTISVKPAERGVLYFEVAAKPGLKEPKS